MVGVELPPAGAAPRRLVVGATGDRRAFPGGSLVLRDARRKAPSRTAVIEVLAGRPREHLFRTLVAAYLGGAQEFVVREPLELSPETRAVARSFARRTFRPEVVSEEGGTLVLRDVSRGGDLEVPPLLRRMFQVVVALQSDAGRTWHEPDRLRGVDWAGRDDDVDRHAWLIERILSLRWAESPRAAGSDGLDGPSPLQTMLLVRSLERIGDHAVQIAEHGLRWSETSPPDRFVRPLTELHAQVLDLLHVAVGLATESRDANRANDAIDLGEALHATYETLSESFFARGSRSGLSAVAGVPLGLLLQSIDRTVSYGQDIAEVGLDRSVEVLGGAAAAERGDGAPVPTIRPPPSDGGGGRARRRAPAGYRSLKKTGR